jgi:cytochrome o ubiquinol oxidase subunit 1
MTGVMLAIPPVDFQLHNSLFLIAHFHNVIIGGVLFGYFAGMIYWFPKAFGFRLNEMWGKWSFGFWVAGFYIAFMPLYILGLNGVMRRINHYDNVNFQPYFVTAAIGAAFIMIGIILMLVQLYVSIRDRHSLRDKTGDPWNGRTLEWSVSSPAPLYNFAFLPTVTELDQLWVDKENDLGKSHVKSKHYHDIHMPRNTSFGFIIAMLAGVIGFAIVWHMLIPGIAAFAGIIIAVMLKSFNTDTDYYVDAETVRKTELAHMKEIVK